MAILALCIFCNVLLAIIFKWFAKYEVDNLNAIIVNYGICVIAASIFLGDLAVPVDLISRPWIIYAVLLAAFLIVGFNVLALSFQKCGVALTVIVQKMSLIIPASFAIALYGESLNIIKGLGILMALLSVVLVNLPDRSRNGQVFRLSLLFLSILFFTWLLSGLIEILLFYVEAEGYVTDDSLQFTASSFGLAAVFGLIYAGVRYFRQRVIFSKKDFIGGIVLGIPNFLTIYLLLVLLSKGWEGSVLFPMNNIGILLFTAVIGVIFYREKLDTKKTIGLVTATLAILLIGFS